MAASCWLGFVPRGVGALMLTWILEGNQIMSLCGVMGLATDFFLGLGSGASASNVKSAIWRWTGKANSARLGKDQQVDP